MAALAALAASLGWGSGCGAKLTDRAMDADLLLEDEMTFAALESQPVGSRMNSVILERFATDGGRWLNLGLLPDGGLMVRREVDLLTPVPLVPVGEGLFATIGTIAVTSIRKADVGRPPYLYDTLAQLFRVLPPSAQVNVLVGDDQVDYVSPAALAERLDPDIVARVHLHPTSPEQARFLSSHLSIYARGGWNYARALRGHRGSKGLLLLEDDVSLAREAVARADAVWRDHPTPMASVYNANCALPPAGERPGPGEVVMTEPDFTRRGFCATQAVLYDGALTQALARYMHLRLHEDRYDLLVSAFTRAHGLQMGRMYPSLVQHEGVVSTGLAGVRNFSPCFADALE